MDVSALADADLDAGFAALRRAREAAEAEGLRFLGEVDRRRTYANGGHLSTVSWLVAEFGSGGGEAAGSVKTARALEEMPLTREALASGRVSTSAARVLAQARDAAPDAFAKDEGLLVEMAREHTVDGLNRATAAWRQRVDQERALEGLRRLRAARRLSVCPTPSGMVRINGDLDPETGECVLTALKAVTDAEAKKRDPSDARTAPQRQADALGTVCRSFLDRPDRPMVGAERPHITVIVDVDDLNGSPGDLAEFGFLGPIHPAVVRELSCDAALARVITKGRSEPLDVGRKTQVVPVGIRRAVLVRDRCCRFPGCDRPPGWCDCHHVIHWIDGGRTALSNLVLLCRRHHRAIHEGSFVVEIVDGEPVFRRPDGPILSVRRPLLRAPP